ncbi:MAG: 30S ribosome-binding factor RbfA [Proteobacteria bacterium]|nr:30S ribosome-binding factor RbfA [Pseudomonadota bacterium]
MPKEFNRSDRIAELIQQELAQLIQFEVKDPRITSMITVSAVRVTRDLEHAKVYITVFGDAEQEKICLKILNHAASFFRRELSHRIDMRVVPELTFVYDHSLEEGNKIADLLRNIEKD